MKEQNHLNDDSGALWRAVLARDPAPGGDAVYAVRSTGIYCRFDCPSRRPRREQVTFFASGALAEQAGFRPCQRCRPDRSAAPMVERVEQACRILESEGPLPLAELARRLDASPHHLQRTFKAITGVSPHQYAAQARRDQLKAQLRAGQPVTAALYEVGFGSSSRLYETAAQELGMTPGEYRQGAKKMNIHYTIVDAPLVGRLLVAGTERGICSVTFGDADADLEAALAAEYPSAVLARNGDTLAPWVSAILAHLGGQLPHLDLPLDVQASAFRLRVWEALRKIPYGETRTYAQVAAAIGKPAAVRAVANACAANPAALVTPCHRVVRTDGGLGGYRWGISRKEALLAQENGMWSVSEKVASMRLKLDDPNFPGITYRRGASGWVTPVLRGTGIRVQTIAVDLQNGMLPEEIANEYDLPAERIREARAFYQAHHLEIDANIRVEKEMEEK